MSGICLPRTRATSPRPATTPGSSKIWASTRLPCWKSCSPSKETTGISVENDELREIATLGQVKEFIARKISTAKDPAAAKAEKSRRYSKVEVAARLPQQPPFFFLEDAEIKGKVVRSSYSIAGSEAFLEGHFKDNPVMPASLVFEALGQAACLWVLECAPEQLGVELGTNEVLFASMEEAHFYRSAVPGDRLDFEVEMVRIHAPVAVFRGTATRSGEKVAHIEHLVLAFGKEVMQHLSTREAGAKREATPMNDSATPIATAGTPNTDLPIVPPTRAEDAPKGDVTRQDRARPDPEDPVNKGEPAPATGDFDRNFGI